MAHPLQKVGILKVYIMYTSTVHLEVPVQTQVHIFCSCKIRYNQGILKSVPKMYLFQDGYFRYTIFSAREIKLGYNLYLRCTCFKRYTPDITCNFLIRN